MTRNRFLLLVFLFVLLTVLVASVAGQSALMLQVALTVLTGVLLSLRFLALNRQRKFQLIVAELVPPSVTWLLFGVGGVIAILRVNDIWFYTVYTDTSVLIMNGYATLGILAYFIGFHLVYRFKQNSLEEASLAQAYLITFLILLFDWYGRYKLIRSGMYFNYVAKQVTDITVRGTSLYFQAFHTIHIVSLPLLLYLAYRRAGKTGGWFFKALIAIQLVLTVLEGSRLDLAYSGIALGLALLVIKGWNIRLRVVAVVLAGAYLLFFILGPLIQVARIQMRRDALLLIENPAAIPVRFLTVYIPAIVSQGSGTNSAAQAGTSTPQSVIGRLGSYMSYAASLYESYVGGTPLLEATDLRDSVLQLVPRMFFPGKTALNQDAVSNVHFNVAPATTDSNGTYVTDAFFHAHLVGVLLLMLIAGVALAFTAKHLEGNYGRMGQMVLIGLLPNLSIAGDSFGNYLAAMRNILLLLLLFKVVLWARQLIISIARSAAVAYFQWTHGRQLTNESKDII